MGHLGKILLFLVLTTIISVDAGVLPIEEKFVATDPDNLGSRGNKFYIGFMKNINRIIGRDEPKAVLLVTTTEREPVMFTVTNSSSSSRYMATFGVSTRIEFPADSVVVENGNQKDRYILVQAEDHKTISVYGVNDEDRSTDGFVALSCDGMSLGIPFRRYEYAIVSGDKEITSSSLQTFSEFLLMPCEDDTEIEIVPSQLITVSGFRFSQFGPGGHRDSSKWEDLSGKRPRAGTTLLVVHARDLTGTIIRSSKPIVVFSGHQCAQVPIGKTACDHLVEQIPPQITWGYTFLLNPLAARESGDIYRVATVYDDTEVTVTCVDEGGSNAGTEVLATLNRAQGENWLEYSTSDPNSPPCVRPFLRKFCSLQTTNPVLVVQYSQGYTADTQCTGFDAGDLGDPFMSIIPPVVQYQNNYLITAITAVAGTFPTRYFSISVYKDFFQPSLIMIDGTAVEPDPSNWNRIYCSDGEVCGYGIYKPIIELGDHRIYHSTENAAITVQFYGFQQQNSYGFSAGMELEPLSGTVVQCQEFYEVEETQESIRVTCTRSLDLSVLSRVRITSQDGSANGIMDYVPMNTSFRFRGGNARETEISFEVQILQDDVEEPTKEFFLNVVPLRNTIVLTPLITVRILGIGGCQHLSDIENGMVSVSGLSTGDTATYSCDVRFQLVGMATRTCESNGEWSPTPPVCRGEISISINIPDSEIQESDGTVLVELLLSSPSSKDISVNLHPLGQSATAGTDFEDQLIPVLIAAGKTRVQVEVPIVNDAVVEQSQERFAVRLELSSGDNGVKIGGRGVGTINIVDDDILIGFEKTLYTVDESAGTATVVILVLGGASVFTNGIIETVQVELDTEEDTALGVADFTPASKLLEFSSSAMQFEVDISIRDDETDEQIEQFFSRLALLTTGIDVQLHPDEAVIQITDNDEAITVQLRIPSPSVVESAGAATVIIRVDRPFSEDIEFVVTPSDVTAIAGTDYEGSSITAVIEAGSTVTEVMFTIIDDNIEEMNESFNLSLSLIDSHMGVLLGESRGTVTIMDDDSVVIGFTSRKYIASKPTGEVLVNVAILSGALSHNIPVTLKTVGDSAVDPSDYITTTQVMTFGPSSSEISIAISIVDDDINEAVEQFFARLALADQNTGVDVELNPDKTTIEIIDNDSVQIGFARTLYSIDEAASEVTLSVAVLSGHLSSDTLVRLKTGDNSATDPEDYDAVNKLLTFSATDTRHNIVIVLNNDEINENTEDFLASLTFEGAVNENIQLQPHQSTVRITDDDAVIIGFQKTLYSVEESNGAVTVSVRVLSNSVLANNVVVRLSTNEDSAIVSEDYTSTTQLLTFSDTTTQHDISIFINDDNVNEGLEQFFAGLEFESVDIGKTIQLNPNTVTIKITDNDGILIGFDKELYFVNESDGRVTLGIAVLVGQLSNDIIVQLNTRDSRAKAPDDYTAVNDLLLTFTATNMHQDVDIALAEDSINEDTEDFLASLAFVGAVGNSVQLGPNQATVQIKDNDLVRIGFEEMLYFVDESAGEITVSVGVLSGTLSGDVMVQVNTNDNSAAAPGDYKSTAQQLTFSATNTRSDVTITIENDNVNEALEQFFAGLRPRLQRNDVDDSIELTPFTAVIMIMDDDGVQIGFEETQYTVNESFGEVTVSVAVLSGDLSSDVVVRLDTTERSAEAPDDFEIISRLLTFTSNITSIQVQIPVIDDSKSESQEDFVANLTLSTTGIAVDINPGETIIIINDNDAPEPTFELTMYSVPENNRTIPLCIDVGVQVIEAITYTITAMHKDPQEAEDADFGSSASITVNPFTSRACIDFSDLVIDDDIALEGNQTFIIVVGNSMAMVTILDDDVPEPVFEFTMYTVRENDRTVPLCIDVGFQVSESVAYTITAMQIDPPQAEDADFGTRATITVTPPSSRACIDFTDLVINDDIAVEGNQAFTIVVGNSMAMVTITDDDVPDIQVPNVTVNEDEGIAEVCIEIRNQIESPFTVEYGTRELSNSASVNDDFTSNTGTLRFRTGDSESCIEISITDDANLESNELFSIDFSFSLPPNTPVVPSISAVVTIVDNDVVVRFDPISYMVTEGVNNVVTLMLFRTGNTDLTAPVNITTVFGTASGLDYASIDVEVVFPSGEIKKSFDISILDDSVLEGLEVFTVVLSSTKSNVLIMEGSNTATVSIIDTDRVQVAFNPVSYMVSEGNTRDLRIVLSGNSEVPVEVLLSTTGMSATGNADYNELTAVSVIFMPGVNIRTVTLTTLPDVPVEGDEDLMATLTVSTNNIDSGRIDVAVSDASVTITENIVPVLSGNVTVLEDVAMVQVCLRLSVPLSANLTVPLTLGNSGSATADVDFRMVESAVTFLAGAVESCVQIVIVDDSVALEGNETVVVTFAPPSGIQQGSPPSFTLTIIDNDALILKFEEPRYSVLEGDVIQVCLIAEGLTDSSFTAFIEISDITAFVLEDYENVTVELEFDVFSSGLQQRQCFNIATTEDSTFEAAETFEAIITRTTDQRLDIRSPAFTVIEIVDDDDVPVLRFTTESTTVLEGVVTTQVCLVLSTQLASSLVVPLTLRNTGTATADVDFRVVDLAVTFLAGAVESCVQIMIVDDSIALERNETVIVTFAPPSGIQQGSPPSSTVTIIDNDVVTLRFEEPQYSSVEGDVVEVCLVAEGGFDTTFTAQVDSSDITAIVAEDYENVITLLEFVAGLQRQCLNVVTTSDNVPESVETFRVVISETSDSRVEITTPTSAVIEILDDDEVIIRLEESAYTVDEGEAVEVCAIITIGTDSTVTASLLGVDGSAIVLEDYDSITSVFTFQPLVTRSCITINIIDDNIVENTEQFSVSLSSPSSTVTVIIGQPRQATVVIRDNDEEVPSPSPPDEVVCEISSPMQVTPFSTSSMYSFSGVCDHWLVAPTRAANGVEFAVIVKFFEEDLRIQEVVIKYGDLQLVSTADGDAESNIRPIDDSTPGVFVFSGNVIATMLEIANVAEMRDIGVTVRHTYAPEGSESIHVAFDDAAKVPSARGLCGTVDGKLEFGGDTNKVADITNIVQLQQFSRSWIVPAPLQTSTEELCTAVQVNDSIIADPQFSVSTSDNSSEALCYEVHGKLGKYFNLISDTCTSVNAHFTSMPNSANGNRMSTIGIHAVQTEEPVILGSVTGERECVDIRIQLQSCAAFEKGEPLPDMGSIGQVRYRKYLFKNYYQWRVTVPNCERAEATLKITCQRDMLRLDVTRNSHLNSTSHGLLGQFWNVPLTIAKSNDRAYVDVYKSGDAKYRHIPAKKFSMTWDHFHKTCYYVGNSQGGPEFSKNQVESVIEGEYKDYETRGLFDTSFKYQKFRDDACQVSGPL